jgi:hypothetical protein
MRTPSQKLTLTNTPSGWSRGLLWRLAMALLLVAGAGTGLGGESETVSDAETVEYQLKAGFLFNFAKFVQWPATNSAGVEVAQTNEFRIGVVDVSNAHSVLSSALNGKQVMHRRVVIERVETPTAAARCNLLFVTRNPTKQAKEMLAHVAAKPVLTVGETPGFAIQGGCINLVPHEHRLRFEVNLDAAAKAGLKVSSQLSAMAIVVKAQKESER